MLVFQGGDEEVCAPHAEAQNPAVFSVLRSDPKPILLMMFSSGSWSTVGRSDH